MTTERAVTAGDERIPLVPGWSLWPVALVRGAGLPFGLLSHFAAADLLAMPPSDDRDAAIRQACAEATAAIVRDESFREALVWQNPDAIDTWLGDYAARLAADPAARLSRRLNRETWMARYAQRYCTKNDTIGFFGPVAWARFAPQLRGLTQSGGGGIRRRDVYLESWAVAELASGWHQDSRLLPFLPVRLDPATSFRGGQLWRPRRPPADCTPLTAALLAAIDGRRRCGEVLAAAGAGHDAEALRAELWRLHEQGTVQIGFLIPHHERPEDILRGQVEQIPDEVMRANLVHRLDQVVAARRAVQRAQGPEAVHAALGELTREISKAGDTQATRSRQARYGRTPAYLDCRRDTDVLVGADLLDVLRAPLGVLLDSARWLAAEIADVVADGLLERYRWLRARRDVVTLSELQFAAGDVLSPGGPAAARVLEDFQLRWAELLPPGPAGEIRLASAEIGPLARMLFPAREPRWAAARYQSPDLLLSHRPDGSARWVLGELHVALNTADCRVFRTQADDPAQLVALTRADLPGGRLVPMYPLSSEEATVRTYPPPALDPPGLYRYWSFATDQGHPDGYPSVPGSAVQVREQDGELIGEALDGGWSAPVLEFFGEFLTAVAVNLFQIRPRRPHLSRVLLDDVVICRESWSVPVHEAPLPGRNHRVYGHERIREWAAALGLPRHVFARTVFERKPFYVDFCSPLLISNLLHALRRGVLESGPEDRVTVDFVEMLPGPEGLWLSDSLGRAYTSEFRIVAVDGKADGPSSRPLGQPHPTH